jgi:NOL1/NOP2/sun family putative RNA methylase
LPSYTEALSTVWDRVRSSIGSRVEEVASTYGYLSYMVARYLEILGSWEDVLELLNAFERELPRSIRVNTLRFRNPGEVVERLQALGYALTPVPWERYSYTVVKPGRVPLGATHEFLLGGYYLYRGLASLLPPVALNPTGSDRVLDAAAAPGGKTTHMAQLMGGRGLIVAVDVDRERFRALRTNLERMGVENVVALRMDGRLVPKVFGRFFTKALLDAPCTGEGIIQLDRSRKVKTSFEDLVRAHRLQVELLRATVESVVPGGLVLYSTCSIAPEEDEFTVAEVLESSNRVEVVDIPLELDLMPGLGEYFGVRLPDGVRRCRRVYPHKHGMEGFFLCLLRVL